MRDLIFGFPAVGFAPHLPVYASQEATFVSAEEVFSSAWEEDAQQILSSLKPGEFDDAIIKAGQEDEAKQFCGHAKRPFRLIKRFCIQQPSGKLRVLDGAAAGGQSQLSQDGSKLDLCSAIQPGINARQNRDRKERPPQTHIGMYPCVQQTAGWPWLHTGTAVWVDHVSGGTIVSSSAYLWQ